MNQIVKEVLFIRAINSVKDFWDPLKPSFAFIGRSNVGKSSLINTLLSKSTLSRTSKKPGCTKTINLFEINKKYYFIDMPGYGYIKTSSYSKSNEWFLRNQSYLLFIRSLKYVFVLIDSRIGFKEQDLLFMSWLDVNALSYTIVLTKYDKVNSCNFNLLESILKNYSAACSRIFITSSVKKIGIDLLNQHIHRVIV